MSAAQTKARNNRLVDEHLRLVVNLLGRDPKPQELKKYRQSVKIFLDWARRWKPDPETKGK
jgi:hypothetical protein